MNQPSAFVIPERETSMLKLKIAATVLAIAFASSASAGWRSMRVEAADLATFEEIRTLFPDIDLDACRAARRIAAPVRYVILL